MKLLLLLGIALLAAGVAVAAFAPQPWASAAPALTVPGGLLVGSMAYNMWLRRADR